MTIPNMVTTSKAAGEILSVRLKSLIGESNLRGAPMRIEKDAARRNLSITHSTLQRMLTGEGAHLDKLEDVAAYFGVSVWELLHPESSARSTPTLAQALEVVGRALLAADPAMRSSAVDLLVTYVRDPASNDDLIPAIAKRLTAPADLQRRADIERALTKNKEGMETRDISPKTFAGGGDEPTFAKKQ